jgi:hypothetical protein
MRNPVLRNLWITQTYHDLGAGMADRGLEADATWPFFAVWASKTAGSVIRGEELPDWLHKRVETSDVARQTVSDANRHWSLLRLLGGVETLSEDHVLKVVGQACDHVSAQVAAGNRSVFAELAPVFAALASGRKPDQVPGLRRAITAYETALSEPNPDTRSVLVLHANVMAVAHEQHRLQSYIASSMQPPLEELLTKTVDRDVAHWVPGWLVRYVAQACLRELLADVTRAWEGATTTFMMKLVTADETLVLHDTIPPLPPGQDMFPPALARADAGAAVHPWDLTGGTGTPCGADDWTVIGQRMCYIVNLFRSRQRHPGLRKPPFTPEQLATMGERKIPAGPL